jgi:hydrogenase nickel incorporation protein HypA/HybF
MHEMSIALSIITEVEKQIEKHRYAPIEVVYLRIGVLSGVDPQALRFAYELARQNTALANSRLEIESVLLRVYCSKCGAIHTPDPQHIFCPECVTPAQEILEGRELELHALELAA